MKKKNRKAQQPSKYLPKKTKESYPKYSIYNLCELQSHVKNIVDAKP